MATLQEALAALVSVIPPVEIDIQVGTTPTDPVEVGGVVVEDLQLKTVNDIPFGPEARNKRLLRLEQLLYFISTANPSLRPNETTNPESARIFDELLDNLREDVINDG